jgi:predicted CoA-binding protein
MSSEAMQTAASRTPGRWIDDDAGLAALLRATRRIAVLGIKTEAQAEQPAYYVAAAMAANGFEIVPVPVYYPEATQILRQPVYRSVAAIPGPVDLVCVFRLPSALPGHLDDLLAARPRAVWLQLGIRHDAFALRLAEAGIDVVQDRCLMVEQRRLGIVPARAQP